MLMHVGKRLAAMPAVTGVGRCSARGGSQGMFITFASAQVNKAESTLALKPRGDITRNPK